MDFKFAVLYQHSDHNCVYRETLQNAKQWITSN